MESKLTVPKAKLGKEGFFIEITCPGCGGELELKDNFFAVKCNHCSSAHRLIQPDSPPAFLAKPKTTKQEARFSIDRFSKENNLPLTSSDYQLKQIFYPYWKIDAVLFRYRKKVEKRIAITDSYDTEADYSYETEKIDVSLSPYTTTLKAGVHFDGLPDTIGMRSEYIKMQIFSNDTIDEDFDTLKVLKPWDDIRDSLNSHVGSIGSFDSNLFGANKTELFCPKASLIYFPFFIFDFYEDEYFRRYVIDGITGRVINSVSELKMESYSPDYPDITFGNIDIVQHRCLNCGLDLPAEESLVYICSNCSVLTDLEPGAEITGLYSADYEPDPNDIMVPFWSLKLSDEDKKRLKTNVWRYLSIRQSSCSGIQS